MSFGRPRRSGRGMVLFPPRRTGTPRGAEAGCKTSAHEDMHGDVVLRLAIRDDGIGGSRPRPSGPGIRTGRALDGAAVRPHGRIAGWGQGIKTSFPRTWPF